MKRVSVYTKDEYLYKKISLSLPDCEVKRAFTEDDAVGSVCVFIDIDTLPVKIEGAVTMSRRSEADLSIPFSLDAPSAMLSPSDLPSCTLLPQRRSVILEDKEIRLTELEYALFELIVSAGEECVSREEILERVWGGEADGGIVNVYVHYLREKLERRGEKLITSHRGRGYTLSEKYRLLFAGGKKNA